MESYQLAIYGVLVLIAWEVTKFFLNNYMKKTEKFKDDQITEILVKIKEISAKLDHIEATLQLHSIDIAVYKETQRQCQERINKHLNGGHK
jgi:GH35 family endo-1,4-beta-xylanase